MSIHSKVETIGPEQAHAYIERMVCNRVVSAANVARLAEAMRRGEWDLNGEPIILDKNGLLLDGQHRLLAVIESGVSIQALVVRGVEKSAFDSIDTGKARTASDICSMLNLPFSSGYGAALSWIYRWESGKLGSRGAGPAGKATNPIVRSLARRYPEVRESVEWIYARRFKEGPSIRFLCRAYMMFAHWAFHKAYPRKADSFFESLASGANLDTTDPVYALRRRLIGTIGAQARTLDHVLLAWTIKSWNAYVKGSAIGTLRFKADEDYPEIAGLATPKEALAAIHAARLAEDEAEMTHVNNGAVAVA